MSQFRLPTIILILMVTASSCSKKLTYFTEDLYESYNWDKEDMKRIQFYVSQDVHLYRSGGSDNSTIEDGKIKLNSQERIEEIIIEKGTPGTLVFTPDTDRFAVSFDDPGEYLMFAPSEKMSGRFVLRAKKWNKRGKGGIVSYGGKEYSTTSDAAYAALLVDVKKAKKSIVTSEKASGSRVNKD